MSMVLHIPVRSSTLLRRFPKYVSASTQGVRIIVQASAPTPLPPPFSQDFAVIPGSSTCPLSSGSYVCTLSMSVPEGTPSFVVQLFDQPPPAPSSAGMVTTIPAGAAMLASGTLQNYSIPVGTPSVTIPITLSGVAWTVDSAVSSGTFLPRGAAGQVAVTARVRDPDGNIIIGNAQYADPSGAPTTITLAIPASITGYQVAVEPAGSSTFGAPGTFATITSPGDQIQVTEMGGASNQAGVVLFASIPGHIIGMLRVPVNTTGAADTLQYSCCGNVDTVTAVPPDVAVPGNAPGQGVFTANAIVVNGSVIYLHGESPGTSITCTALNALDVGLAPGYPGIFTTAQNGGYFYYRAYSMTAFAGGCTQNAGDFAGYGGNSQTAFPTCGFAPPFGHEPPCSQWGMPEAYPFNPGGGPVTVYINSDFGSDTGILTATYTPGSFSSLTYSATGNLFTASGSMYGLAPLPGRVFAALRYSPGYDVLYPGSGTMIDGTNATVGIGGLESPVALNDGTIYAIANGNLARCHVDPNPAVTTGVSCDPTVFATLAPPAYVWRERTMALGPDGALWYATGAATIGRFDLNTLTATSFPTGGTTISVTSGNDGRLYYTDTSSVFSYP